MKLPRETGVYAIFNTISHKFYIGSTSEAFLIRFRGHKNAFKVGIHHNQHMQREYDKYGFDKFKFIILEKCPPEECIIKEQCYLDTLNPSYNMCPLARSSRGVKRSKELKEHFSQMRMGYKNPMFGRCGKLNPAARPLRAKNKINNEIIKFETIKEASAYFQISLTNFRKFLFKMIKNPIKMKNWEVQFDSALGQ